MTTARRPRSALAEVGAAVAGKGEAERIARIAGGLSEKTQTAYASVLRAFTRWCRANREEPLPCGAHTLARYIDALEAQGKSFSTMTSTVAALGHVHDARGLVSPSRDPMVRATLARARRTLRARHRAPKQSVALTEDRLPALIGALAASAQADPPNAAERVRRVRDEALVRTMRDALLRRAEASELRWHDLEVTAQGTGTLTVQRVKRDVTSTAFLGAETVSALDAWRALSPPGPRIFALSPSQIARRIKAAAARAGLHGLTTHGARIGMAQDLCAAGVELPALMVAGGWKNAATVEGYVRRQSAERSAVARYYARHHEGPARHAQDHQETD